MNHRCDVYTYEDVMGGWTTHVAARRRPVPPVPDLMASRLSRAVLAWSGLRMDMETRELTYASPMRARVCKAWHRVTFWWHVHLHMRSLDLIPLRPIGLPFDGETFNDPTPGECAERLEWLRGLGYVVPQFAIDALRAEVEDGAVVGVEG